MFFIHKDIHTTCFLFGHMFSYLYIRVIVANTFSIIKNVSTHYSEKTHRYEHYPHVAVGINIRENIYHSQHNSDMETSVDNQEKDCMNFYIYVWFFSFKQNYPPNPSGIHIFCMLICVCVSLVYSRYRHYWFTDLYVCICVCLGAGSCSLCSI